MKRMLRIALAATASLAIVAGAAVAEPKGSLKIAGSTTVLPLSQVWAETFMMKYNGARISVSGGGTGTGISMLTNGTCDIANASRAAKKKEIDAARTRNTKLVETKLAKDGLAIIVHSSSNVKNLTMDQLQAMYSGKIQNWKEVGGNSGKGIVLVGRDTSSGTYGFFQEAVLDGGNYAKDMLSMPSNAAIAQAVAQSRDAIGYVGIAYADDYVKKGKVNIVAISLKKGQKGILPTRSTIDDGSYPLFRYLYAYTNGTPKGLVGDFLKWCTGAEGQSLVHKAGYEPLK